MTPTKHLLLWRHAEAEEGYPDLSRALTPHGQQQAQRMANWLRRQIPQSLYVMASPALRTQQTAHAFTKQAHTLDSLGTAASVQDLLNATGWPDMPSKPVLLVVGHQPTLGEAVATLLTGEKLQWSIRKGALWWLMQRSRQGQVQIILRAVIDPDFL